MVERHSAQQLFALAYALFCRPSVFTLQSTCLLASMPVCPSVGLLDISLRTSIHPFNALLHVHRTKISLSRPWHVTDNFQRGVFGCRVLSAAWTTSLLFLGQRYIICSTNLIGKDSVLRSCQAWVS